jgi:hypothetical protein
VTDDTPRCFAVTPAGVATALSVNGLLALMGVPPAVSAAYDLLTDDGMAPDRAAELAMTAHRTGRDPEELARKVVRLRRGLRAG